jgi:hypothetical protein
LRVRSGWTDPLVDAPKTKLAAHHLPISVAPRWRTFGVWKERE